MSWSKIVIKWLLSKLLIYLRSHPFSPNIRDHINNFISLFAEILKIHWSKFMVTVNGVDDSIRIMFFHIARNKKGWFRGFKRGLNNIMGNVISCPNYEVRFSCNLGRMMNLLKCPYRKIAEIVPPFACLVLFVGRLFSSATHNVSTTLSFSSNRVVKINMKISHMIHCDCLSLDPLGFSICNLLI